MVTATERLRELLDERGVFWIDVPLVNMKRTCWKSSEKQDGYCYFDEDAFGVMELTVTSLTPEQAIAATLGSGTCHDLAETPAYRDKTEFKCSECGYEYSAVGGFGCDSGDEPDFNFCPNCGRRVEVGE